VLDEIYTALRRITPAAVVGTWAGTPSLTTGSADGPFNVGRFNHPQGVAVDQNGVCYVADSGNHTIRRVLPSSETTTFAGLTGLEGSTDGTGSGARFSAPSGVAVDSAGNVYVTDYNNSTIRKITPGGVVTTLAGQAGIRGSADGAGPAARFDNPDALAVDTAGNLFVSDSNNHTLRKITPDGVVTTIAGLAGTSGVAEGTGSAARFFIPSGITIAPGGVLYVVSAYGNVVMRGALDSLPSFTAHPQSQNILAGSGVTLSATATGGGLRYQWKFNGVAIPGANGPTFTLLNATAGSAGDYTVEITNSAGVATSSAATLTVTGVAPVSVARLSNLSVRAAMAPSQTLIVGFSVSGGSRGIVVRGVGPTLASFGLGDAMADPRLELYNGSALVAENEDWGNAAALSTAFSNVGAFPLIANSRDAAFLQPIDGTRSVHLKGTGAGVALVELYDTGLGDTPRLVNVSARNQVGTGDNILIFGFFVDGTGTKNVLIRAIGPRLVDLGVTGVLADPRFDVFRAGSTVAIAGNDNWDASLAATFNAVGAFGLTAGSRDAALVTTLTPGSYTVQVSGVSGTTGEALVESYEVP
jgi:hypothetical protein